MTLSEQIEAEVCSIEQSIRLLQLGITRKSIWSSAVKKNGAHQVFVLNREGKPPLGIDGAHYSDWKLVPRYSIGELLRMLPYSASMFITPEADGWKYEEILYPSHAQACAEALIQKLDNEWLHAKDLNELP